MNTNSSDLLHAAFRQYLVKRFLQAPADLRKQMLKSKAAMSLFRAAVLVDFTAEIKRTA